jgi:hypothetical protein
MKKIFSWLLLPAAALLGSCTLYMDGDEEEIIRTGEGYVEEATIELDDDKGSVTYKYNQHTIAINDEVEGYVAAVENDSVVWFVDGTPEGILPEVGEMMVCSFRDKFPHGFCRRVFARTEENGMYKCLTEGCDLFDAFDVLEVDCKARNTMDLGGVEVDPEEYFKDVESLGAREVYYCSPDAASRELNVTRGWWDDEDLKKQFGDGKFLELKPSFKLGAKVGGSTFSLYAGCELGASITVGPILNIILDSKKKYKEISLSLVGGIQFFFKYDVKGEITLEPPVAIPILGDKFDIKVFGVEVGGFIVPYIYFSGGISGEASFSLSTGFKVGYFEENGKGGMDMRGVNVGKRPGNPVLVNTLANPDVSITMQLGADFRVALGAGIFDDLIRAGVKCGAKVYGEVSHTFKLKDMGTIDMYRGKTLDINIKSTTYAEAEAGAVVKFAAGIEPTTKTLIPPIKLPWWPTLASYYFYKSDLEKNEYTMGFTVDDPGILAWALSFHDQSEMRVYDSNNMIVETFKVKQVGGLGVFSTDARTFTCKAISNKLKDNEQYYVRPVMSASYKAKSKEPNPSYLDFDKFPVMTSLPSIEIVDAQVIQTQKGSFGVSIGSGKTATYAYMYRIRSKAKITDTRNCRKWGIMLRNENYIQTSFETENVVSTTASVSPTVEWLWYSNKPSFSLSFIPYIMIDKAKGKQTFTEKVIDVKYDKALETPNQSIGEADFKAVANEF